MRIFTSQIHQYNYLNIMSFTKYLIARHVSLTASF